MKIVARLMVILALFFGACDEPKTEIKDDTPPLPIPSEPRENIDLLPEAQWICVEDECLALRDHPIVLEIHENDWPALLVAAQRWNDFSELPIFEIGPHQNVDIIPVDSFPIVKENFHVLAATTAIDQEGCVIEVREDLTNDVDLFTHELGHCIGFIHAAENEGSIMWFALRWGSGQGFTKGQYEALQEFYR